MRNALLGGLVGLILGSLAAAGIMMILFFPKFAQMREQQAEAEALLADARARAEVANNLKQLGLAVHNLQEAKKEDLKKVDGPSLAEKKLEELKAKLSEDEKIVLEKAQALVEDLCKNRLKFIIDTAHSTYRSDMRLALDQAPSWEGALQKITGQLREYRVRKEQDWIGVYVTDQEPPRLEIPGRLVNIEMYFKKADPWVHYNVQVSVTK